MKFFGGIVLLTTFMTLVVTSRVAVAQYEPQATRPDPVYSEYYTIDEKDFDEQVMEDHGWGFSEPSQMLSDSFVQAARSLVLNLLKWNLHAEVRPMPTDAYIRKLHFGRWINDPTDNTCMNTRAKVLVRDSEEPVSFRNGKQCVVDMGKWQDPYSNSELSNSREIQVDHMVPLKHAYVSGAYQWDYKTRCLYANYLWYDHHLIPSTVRENTSKGDRAPDKYLPSFEGYRCQYVKDWLTVKLIWRLNMTQSEIQAIHQVVTNLNCKVSDFKMTQQDLINQRQHINDNIEYCMLNKR